VEVQLPTLQKGLLHYFIELDRFIADYMDTNGRRPNSLTVPTRTYNYLRQSHPGTTEFEYKGIPIVSSDD